MSIYAVMASGALNLGVFRGGANYKVELGRSYDKDWSNWYAQGSTCMSWSFLSPLHIAFILVLVCD